MVKDLLQDIVVLGTGGTIAGTALSAQDNVGYTAAQLGVAQLLQAVPGLEKSGYRVLTEQVAQLDSKDMSFAVWQRLALRCAHWLSQAEVKAIVITHGTDTLEETAFFLHEVLASNLTAGKPVVLTCAMRPASSRNADGPQNLLDALTLARDPNACGVLSVCAGRFHAALQVQKVHPYRLDAFDSGDAGALGFVEEGQVRWGYATPPHASAGTQRAATDSQFAPRSLDALAALTHWPRVEIVMSHAGADGGVVDALLAQASHALGPVRGIVVAATGNGSVHCALEGALLRAQSAGIRVVRATRCAYGRVLSVNDARIPDSQGLSPVKARVALMLEIAGVSAPAVPLPD